MFKNTQNNKDQSQLIMHTNLFSSSQQFPNDWKAIRRAFKKADVNNESRLSIPDFCLVLQENKIHAKDEDLYQIFSEMDSNMDGMISYDRFLSQVNLS